MKHVKDIKIFLKKKKKKGEKRPEKDIKIFLRNKKRKLLEYMTNYLAHKSILRGLKEQLLKKILSILGQLSLLSV